MMRDPTASTERLVARARNGDPAASRELLAAYRSVLRRIVAVRMDPRLSARLDPSDVVQEILFDASRGMEAYLTSPPVPFLAWLRQLARRKLIDLHRRHVVAGRRSVRAEELDLDAWQPATIVRFAERVLADDTSPGERLIRAEQHSAVKAALAELASEDREILTMRFLEQLRSAEIAEVLGVTEGAAKARILRALLRIRNRLGGPA